MVRKNEPSREVTAALVSLGCFKNVVDSEVLGGMLEKKGIRIVSTYEPADWLIINTCGFIQEAKEESIDEIISALEKREKGEYKNIAVFGCLTQRYMKELSQTFKNVHILWGVKDIEDLVAAICSGKRTPYPNRNLFLYNDTHRRIISTTPNSTFIKISEGCNMACSFCSIPAIRGPYRSRTVTSVAAEAKRYREMGFCEINLVSQSSTYFGKDQSAVSALPELLEAISKLGFAWVRVLYLMPEETDERILEAFSFPSILPYFDLPFQHVSPKILKKMCRRGGFQKNLELIQRIRTLFPQQATIRSSFIVGFPSENEKDFNQLLEFIEQAAIERIGVFSFSAEENTPAFQLKNRVRLQVSKERKNRLLELAERHLERYHQNLLQTVQEFLPLGPWRHNSTIGRIRSQAPEVDGLTEIERKFDGNYSPYPIRITGYKQEILHGEKV